MAFTSIKFSLSAETLLAATSIWRHGKGIFPPSSTSYNTTTAIYFWCPVVRTINLFFNRKKNIIWETCHNILIYPDTLKSPILVSTSPTSTHAPHPSFCCLVWLPCLTKLFQRFSTNDSPWKISYHGHTKPTCLEVITHILEAKTSIFHGFEGQC